MAALFPAIAPNPPDTGNPWNQLQLQAAQIRRQMGESHAQEIKNRFLPQQLQQRIALNTAMSHAQDIKNRFLPQNLQSQIKARLAQANYQQALASNPNINNKSSYYRIIKSPTGYYRYNILNGETTKLTDDSGKPLSPPKSGMSISTFPDGTFRINTGGIQQVSPGGTPSNIKVSQGAPSGSRSTGGRTLIDTQTGKSISIPTKQTISSLQNQKISIEEVVPVLKRLYSKLSKYTGILGASRRLKDRVTAHSFTPNPDYSDYVSTLKAGIPIAADLLLKSLNLPKTNESLQKMLHSLTPTEFETKEQLGTRFATILSELIGRNKHISSILKGGILTDFQNKDFNKNYQDALNELTNIVPRKTNASPPITIPTFYSDAAYKKWYSSLSEANQKKVRQQIKEQEARR